MKATIPDPYRTPAHEEEIQRLSSIKYDEPGQTDLFIAGAVCLAFVSLCVGVVTGLIAELLGADGLSVVPWVGGICFGLGGLGLIGLCASEAHAKRKLARLEASRPVVDVYRPNPYHHVVKATQEAAYILSRLPEAARNEIRPLWDSILEANALMIEVGEDPVARKRVLDRTRALKDFERAHRAMEAAEAEAKREAKVAAAKSAYCSTDDSDLMLASIYTEAIQEGTRRYRELSSGGPTAEAAV